MKQSLLGQPLSPRERECMDLICKGYRNKEIAEWMSISVRTVDVHRDRVFRKMGVTSAVQLLRKSLRLDETEATT